MMKELGYENVCVEYYYKEPKIELDNGLRKLATDKDVLEMIKHVAKYKVIDLYVDHSVPQVPKVLDNALLVGLNDNLKNADDVVDNDIDDVLDDVSEDEWLQNCLSKVGRMSKDVGQSSKNVDNVGDSSGKGKGVNDRVQSSGHKRMYVEIEVKLSREGKKEGRLHLSWLMV